MIDNLNPDLRVSKNREFFVMSPEDIRHTTKAGYKTVVKILKKGRKYSVKKCHKSGVKSRKMRIFKEF